VRICFSFKVSVYTTRDCMELQQPVESVWQMYQNVCQEVCQEGRWHLFDRNGGKDPLFVQDVGGPLGGVMVAPEMRKILVKLTAKHKDSTDLQSCSSAFRNGATIAKLPYLLTSPNTFRL
jgi:hypothetical protein